MSTSKQKKETIKTTKKQKKKEWEENTEISDDNSMIYVHESVESTLLTLLNSFGWHLRNSQQWQSESECVLCYVCMYVRKRIMSKREFFHSRLNVIFVRSHLIENKVLHFVKYNWDEEMVDEQWAK